MGATYHATDIKQRIKNKIMQKFQDQIVSSTESYVYKSPVKNVVLVGLRKSFNPTAGASYYRTTDQSTYKGGLP